MQQRVPFPEVHEIISLQRDIARVLTQDWLGYVFEPLWWGQLLGLVLPWLLFWRVYDRRQIYPLILVMFYAQFFFALLDGELFGQAVIVYMKRLQPIRYPFLPVAFALMPVTAALLYQYCRRFSAYAAASVVTALLVVALYRFVLQPLGIAVFTRSPYVYLFFGSVGALLLARYLTNVIMNMYAKSGDSYDGAKTS